MSTRNSVQRSIAFLLILSCLDGHLSRADHHPYCLSDCAPHKLLTIRVDCLLRCNQKMADVTYRIGRSDPSSYSPYFGLGGDEERDEGESIEVPFDDVILREPRDRSAFVRIGKRDVSSVTKRRDEFVRIGKGVRGHVAGIGRAEPRHISRAPFLLSRTYRGLSDTDGAEKQQLEQPTAEIAKRKTILIPLPGSIKRPSAFVRIGKSEKPEDEEEAAAGETADPRVSQPHPTDGNPEYGGINRASAADDLYPRADDTPGGEQVDKKASAFVRIGRGRGAAFVRIGKSEPSFQK